LPKPIKINKRSRLCPIFLPGNGDSGAPSENGQTEEDVKRVEPEKEEGHGQSARSVAGRKGEFINTVSHQHVTLIDLKSSNFNC
jgi:hypothetical protein